MKSAEGIFKMLSKSSIIRNQYENVIPSQSRYLEKFKTLRKKFLGVFLYNFSIRNKRTNKFYEIGKRKAHTSWWMKC